MITMIGKDDGAIAHIGVNPNKVSVLSGGVSALLRRLGREDTAGHRVRLHYVGGNGAYVEWPSLSDAADGIATERPRPPVPSITTWR